MRLADTDAKSHHCNVPLSVDNHVTSDVISEDRRTSSLWAAQVRDEQLIVVDGEHSSIVEFNFSAGKSPELK